MKYLKRYNENISSDDILPTNDRLTEMLDNIEYMFLDCKENGFNLDYSGVLLNIEITKPVNRGNNMYSNSLFKMSEISDTLHMIMSYLDTFSDMIELESIEINVRKPLGTRFYLTPKIIGKFINREDIDKIDTDISSIHVTYKELNK